MRSAWCAEEPVLVHDGVTQARWTRRASKRFGLRVRLRSQCWASRVPTNSGPGGEIDAGRASTSDAGGNAPVTLMILIALRGRCRNQHTGESFRKRPP